jgi:hypothetical protein
MKVAKLRKLLEAMARQHDALGRGDVATGLRRLAAVLKSQDAFDVSRALEKLKR